jgi:hypothetical protein
MYLQTQTFSLWGLPFRRLEVGGNQINLSRNAFLVEKSSAPRDLCQQRAGVTKLQILKNGLSQKRNLSILAASPVKNSMRFDANNENKYFFYVPNVPIRSPNFEGAFFVCPAYANVAMNEPAIS